MQSRLTTSKSFGYGLIVTVVFFLFAEGLARVVEAFVPASGVVDTRRIPVKENGTYRIFVFGGSTVFGEPVPEYGFVAQLEYWLRELNPERPVEVFNFGRPSRPSAFVRDRVREAAGLGPDLFIILTGHNEFLNRATERSLSRLVDRFALVRVLAREWKRIRVAYFPLPSRIVMPVDMKGFDRKSELFKTKLDEYERNVKTMAAVAEQYDIPVLFLTVPSNVADWPPVYLHFESPERKREFFEIQYMIDSGKWGQAEKRLSAGLKKSPDDSLLLFLHGLILKHKRNFIQASATFMKAKDLDPLPWRAPSHINEIIRSLAASEHVFVADIEKSFFSNAENGLVGFDLFADNCHPTPEGNAIIAREILSVMGSKGWFLTSASGQEENAARRLDRFLSSIPFERRRHLKRVYTLNNARYAMKTPFFNFKASKMYLERARRIDGNNWVVWANLATLAFLENRPRDGRRLFQKAARLRGKAIDPEDRRNTPYLKEALGTQSGDKP